MCPGLAEGFLEEEVADRLCSVLSLYHLEAQPHPTQVEVMVGPVVSNSLPCLQILQTEMS